VLRAGLATAPRVTVDDTAARHARRDGVTTRIGDDRFTAFRTGGSKSREAFLSALRAGHDEYVIDAAALAYMRDRAPAGPVIEPPAAHPAKAPGRRISQPSASTGSRSPPTRCGSPPRGRSGARSRRAACCPGR
jgi:hypothetical protein